MDRDVTNEETHLSKLEEVVAEHGDLQDRLDNFNDLRFGDGEVEPNLETPAVEDGQGWRQESFLQFMEAADILQGKCCPRT